MVMHFHSLVQLSMSESGSPLPPSHEDLAPEVQEGDKMAAAEPLLAEKTEPQGREKEEEAVGVVRDSPARRSWRNKLSFKRSKSQEETAEGIFSSGIS